jgi:putative transposase
LGASPTLAQMAAVARLNRCPTRPNQVWVADITYVRLRDGFAHPAVLIDYFTRRNLGWESGRSLDRGLA